MRRTRLYVAGKYASGSEIGLGVERTRYLSRVLRLRTGDTIAVFDGAGREFEATIARIDKADATLRIGAALAPVAESALEVHLVQGVSRGERMDFVVQKATELGIQSISPVLTEHGVVRLDATRAAKRQEHWQKVAAGACEQCGRARLPRVDLPTPLKHWFGRQSSDTATDLILRPGAATSLRDLDDPLSGIRLLVGPEGGFSDSEYLDAEAAGFLAVSLGARILRTETAAVAALAVLQSRWGDLG